MIRHRSIDPGGGEKLVEVTDIHVRKAEKCVSFELESEEERKSGNERGEINQSRWRAMNDLAPNGDWY